MIITKSNHLILGAILLAKSNDALNEQIKSNLTPEQLQELKDFYVERLVDNMSTNDLVAYVTDDMSDYVNKLSPVEFSKEHKMTPIWPSVSVTLNGVLIDIINS